MSFSAHPDGLIFWILDELAASLLVRDVSEEVAFVHLLSRCGGIRHHGSTGR